MYNCHSVSKCLSNRCTGMIELFFYCYESFYPSLYLLKAVYNSKRETNFNHLFYPLFNLCLGENVVEQDLSLLIGLSVAVIVFLTVSFISINCIRRKGRSQSLYNMANIGKFFRSFLLPKNDVIQYIWPMIGQYTDLITNDRPVYILIDQW